MARKPAKMYRRLKCIIPDISILVVSQTTEFANSMSVIDVLRKFLKFKMELNLIADESYQIRHTALENTRVVSNSTIRNAAGAQSLHALREFTLTLIRMY